MVVFVVVVVVVAVAGVEHGPVNGEKVDSGWRQVDGGRVDGWLNQWMVGNSI